MRRSSTDETPYRRSPSLDSKAETPPFSSGFHRFSGEFEYKRPPFAFGFHTTKGPQTSKGRYAQGKKYVVFYLDLSFIFLLELRRCRMAEGCMIALRYGMVFFNLLFWVSRVSFWILSHCVCVFVTCANCFPLTSCLLLCLLCLLFRFFLTAKSFLRQRAMRIDFVHAHSAERRVGATGDFPPPARRFRSGACLLC